MSISKAQAAALAEGFLDSVGSSKDGLQPRETLTEIVLLAGELIESAQLNLNQSNSNASGELSASLVAHEPKVEGRTFKIDVYMNFYGLFVNKGVKGTRSGKSNAGYSFKYDMPSKKMIAAIKEWIDRGKINTRTVKKEKGYGKHEIKHQKLANASEANMAFPIARSIKMLGIKPTGFLDKAVVTTKQKVGDRLGLALKIDVLNSISQ